MAAINRLSPILALAVGVAHAGLAPVLVIAAVKPNVVLIATVLAAAFLGPLPGLTVAFVGGLVANAYSAAPFGSVPLALVAVAAVTSLAAPRFGHVAHVYADVAVLAGSIVADLGTAIAGVAMAGGAWPVPPVELVIRAAAVNAGLGALVVLAVRLRHRRRDLVVR